MTILGSYNDVGMTESLNYFLPKHIHDRDSKKITNTFSIALFTQMTTSIILAILLYFFAGFLSEHYFESPQAKIILHILVLQFFADNVFRTISTFFSAIQDTKLQKSMDFLRMFLLMCIVCGLWFFDMHTVEYYAWAWSLAITFGSFVSLFLIVIKYRGYFTIS